MLEATAHEGLGQEDTYCAYIQGWALAKLAQGDFL